MKDLLPQQSTRGGDLDNSRVPMFFRTYVRLNPESPMSIRHAILGFLSVQPLAGYDIKRLFTETDFLPWSGNNNQVYTTLVGLHREGLVTQEVLLQENLPSRKIYRLTTEGRVEIETWLKSEPEPPEFRDVFLVQLAWMDLLSNATILSLLKRYEEEVDAQLAMSREHARRETGSPKRTPRETWLWSMIYENRVRLRETELAWARDLRDGLARFAEVAP